MTPHVCVCITVCVSVCVCVSVSVCLSLTSDSSETIKVTIIKLGTGTASDIWMHHMLIIWTLSFIRGHTYLNHENNKCLIILKTVQAIPVMFTHYCEDSPNEGLYNLFFVRWPCPSFKVTTVSINFDTCLTYICTIHVIIVTVIYWTIFKLWHSNFGMVVDLYIYADTHVDDLDLGTRSQWISRGKQY